MFAFSLPKKPENMEQHMVEMLLDPYQIIGGKHSKQFSGTIDTNGMAVSFHYKCTTSRLRRLPINEGGKSAASHVNGLRMEHIGSVDPDKDKLVAVGNDHPKGLVRTLCRDSYHLFSHGKENTVRQQHLDATGRDELHELSPWTGKVLRARISRIILRRKEQHGQSGSRLE